ncbi:leucine-rich repeat and IQ domain-containing protein 1 [Hoplias malabaricus]|uniref:leucine-rich repeat and IQ domain-containing protein 1 n=1 Tax=Hoplias malabaricus TaxID=27720 RepID=UPI0034627696
MSSLQFLLQAPPSERMDPDAIEQAIDEELKNLNLNYSDVDSDGETEAEEDFSSSDEMLEKDFPQSVLTYIEASQNRVNAFEKLILEDLEEKDTACTELSHQSDLDSLLNELTHDPEEDLMKLKEKIISEIEEHVTHPNEAGESSLEDTKPTSHVENDGECDGYREYERQLIFAWKELEERLKKEDEQRLVQQEAERENHLSAKREEEKKKRFRLEEFEKQLRTLENICPCEHLDDLVGDNHTEESLQVEEAKHKEEIKILEEQLEKERHLYEEMKQEEKRRIEERRCGAATKLQAAFRGALVRFWSKNELIKRREEERKRQEEEKERERRREREERMKRELEEKRKRKEEKEQRQKEELAKRKAEYERAKERERHRLEMERKIEEQRRQEEEAKREDERKKKEDEERRRSIEEVQMEEEKRRVQEEERKSKEEEKKEKALASKQIQKHERRREDEKVNKRSEEQEGPIVEEIRRREEERRKSMHEERVDEEIRGEEGAENKTNEPESKQTHREKKQLEENGGKAERKIIKKNEMEERKMREDESKGMEEERNVEKVEEKRRKSMEKKIEGEKQKGESKQKQEGESKETVQKESKGKKQTMKRNEEMDKQEIEDRSVLKEVKEDVIGLGDQRCSSKAGDAVKCSERMRNVEENAEPDPGPQPCLSQSKKSQNGILSSAQSSSNSQYAMCLTVPTESKSSIVTPGVDKACPEFEVHGKKSAKDTGEHSRETINSTQNCAEDSETADSSSSCLPDSTEQKRLAWIMSCTPWSKLSMLNKRKGPTAPPKKRGIRRTANLPPIPMDTLLKTGPWSALRQVTTVNLEDLPGCSLSTLSECSSLQSLTLRRCGLQALEGLQQCGDLRHIDVQENSITIIDLGSLDRLEVLLLGRNQLTSIHGLDGAVNLTVLQLSYNFISHLSGLGSLKRLQRLSVDHNQLISTRGLCDAFTLLYLDCSYNHLSHVEGLEHCVLLNTLDLRGNSLTESPVLKNHVLLRELYLDDNSISSLQGLDSCWLPLLRCLSVAQNSITQLPLLVDLLSLGTLNVSKNCLSDLSNLCLSLQGCSRLLELSLNDNPLQLDNNWRSSVLATRPSLIKLNGDPTGATVELSAGSTQPWSFRALCQAHQDQLDLVLQRHSMGISLAPSVLDAQLLACKHDAELFRLAEEQRYAHEYGDSSASETTIQKLATSSCLEGVFDGYLKKDQSNQQHPAEQEMQSQPGALPPENVHRSQPEPPAADFSTGCAGGCLNPPQQFSEEQSKQSRRTTDASRMDLKTMAAMVIQNCWRKHRLRRQTSPSVPAKTKRWSPQRRELSNENSSQPPNRNKAATVIQAVWRGYTLRKRLARALALVQVSEGDEAFEEVDMNEFVFDEEAMESDWITMHSNASSSVLQPYSEQLLLPKPPLPVSEPNENTHVLPWKLKQAWIGSEMVVPSEHLSPDPNSKIQSPPSTTAPALSERSEKILEEWGLSSSSTALLMLKRAQKMKPKKQHQRRLQDQAVRLALFNNNSKQPVPIKSPKRCQPECRGHVKVGRAGVSAEDTLSEEKSRIQQHRTYQWLNTQSIQTQSSPANPIREHFLPEIDPDILNGGRVQLVAGTKYRESPDSAAGLWSDATGFFPPHNQQTHIRRHSTEYANKGVPSPKRVNSAPSQKERISFRDNPVRLSGGWGGGKKRAKVNK